MYCFWDKWPKINLELGWYDLKFHTCTQTVLDYRYWYLSNPIICIRGSIVAKLGAITPLKFDYSII